MSPLEGSPKSPHIQTNLIKNLSSVSESSTPPMPDRRGPACHPRRSAILLDDLSDDLSHDLSNDPTGHPTGHPTADPTADPDRHPAPFSLLNPLVATSSSIDGLGSLDYSRQSSVASDWLHDDARLETACQLNSPTTASVTAAKETSATSNSTLEGHLAAGAIAKRSQPLQPKAHTLGQKKHLQRLITSYEWKECQFQSTASFVLPLLPPPPVPSAPTAAAVLAASAAVPLPSAATTTTTTANPNPVTPTPTPQRYSSTKTPIVANDKPHCRSTSPQTPPQAAHSASSKAPPAMPPMAKSISTNSSSKSNKLLGHTLPPMPTTPLPPAPATPSSPFPSTPSATRASINQALSTNQASSSTSLLQAQSPRTSPMPQIKAPFSFHCTICYEAFHPTKRPPVVLPCGHTYICDECGKRLTKCMECRKSTKVAFLPKNYNQANQNGHNGSHTGGHTAGHSTGHNIGHNLPNYAYSPGTTNQGMSCPSTPGRELSSIPPPPPSMPPTPTTPMESHTDTFYNHSIYNSPHSSPQHTHLTNPNVHHNNAQNTHPNSPFLPGKYSTPQRYSSRRMTSPISRTLRSSTTTPVRRMSEYTPSTTHQYGAHGNAHGPPLGTSNSHGSLLPPLETIPLPKNLVIIGMMEACQVHSMAIKQIEAKKFSNGHSIDNCVQSEHIMRNIDEEEDEDEAYESGDDDDQVRMALGSMHWSGQHGTYAVTDPQGIWVYPNESADHINNINEMKGLFPDYGWEEMGLDEHDLDHDLDQYKDYSRHNEHQDHHVLDVVQRGSVHQGVLHDAQHYVQRDVKNEENNFRTVPSPTPSIVMGKEDASPNIQDNSLIDYIHESYSFSSSASNLNSNHSSHWLKKDSYGAHTKDNPMEDDEERQPPPPQDSTNLNATTKTESEKKQEQQEQEITVQGEPYHVQFGSLIQIVDVQNNIAKLARGRGFIVMQDSQLLKVGAPKDELCQIEGMLHTASRRRLELESLLHSISYLEDGLAAHLHTSAEHDFARRKNDHLAWASARRLQERAMFMENKVGRPFPPDMQNAERELEMMEDPVICLPEEDEEMEHIREESLRERQIEMENIEKKMMEQDRSRPLPQNRDVSVSKAMTSGVSGEQNESSSPTRASVSAQMLSENSGANIRKTIDQTAKLSSRSLVDEPTKGKKIDGEVDVEASASYACGSFFGLDNTTRTDTRDSRNVSKPPQTPERWNHRLHSSPSYPSQRVFSSPSSLTPSQSSDLPVHANSIPHSPSSRVMSTLVSPSFDSIDFRTGRSGHTGLSRTSKKHGSYNSHNGSSPVPSSSSATMTQSTPRLMSEHRGIARIRPIRPSLPNSSSGNTLINANSFFQPHSQNGSPGRNGHFDYHTRSIHSSSVANNIQNSYNGSNIPEGNDTPSHAITPHYFCDSTWLGKAVSRVILGEDEANTGEGPATSYKP